MPAVRLDRAPARSRRDAPTPSRIASGCSSHRRVEPSRSVNKNVTVPDGNSVTTTPCGPQPEDASKPGKPDDRHLLGQEHRTTAPPANSSPPATNPTPRSTSKATATPRGASSSSSSPRAPTRSTAASSSTSNGSPPPAAKPARAIDCFTRLAPHIPGAQGVIYDTALRGVHHQHLLRELGLLPINRVTAAKASPKKPRRNERRVEKNVHLEDKTITLADGTPPHASRSTRPAARSASASSPTPATYTSCALPRIRTHRNAGKNGRYRWYNDYQLPDRVRTPDDHRPTPRQRRRHRPEVEPDREPPAHPTRRSRLRTALPAPQRRRVHQPPPRRHHVARPRPQHRPRPPTPQPPRLRARRSTRSRSTATSDIEPSHSPRKPRVPGQLGDQRAPNTAMSAVVEPTAPPARPKERPETPLPLSWAVRHGGFRPPIAPAPPPSGR